MDRGPPRQVAQEAAWTMNTNNEHTKNKPTPTTNVTSHPVTLDHHVYHHDRIYLQSLDRFLIRTTGVVEFLKFYRVAMTA
mmetsp:Transcript_781/g.1436  ORF Transcript_781/g.1436 Transcript_781/m.1436 type:complete len:80 (+) Transcript_781:103-342(+)